MRVLIVDDHAMFTESLARLLVSRGSVCEVVVADSLAAVRRAAPQLAVEMAVVDWRLGDGSAPDVIEVLREQCPDAKVVLLSGLLRPATVRHAIQLGCEGVITKEGAADELLDALARVERGETAMSTAALTMLAHSAEPEGGLTARELEVIDGISRGLGNREIADELFLSINTVRNHIQRISAKIGAGSRLDIAMIALREGWIDLPPASGPGGGQSTSTSSSINAASSSTR